MHSICVILNYKSRILFLVGKPQTEPFYTYGNTVWELWLAYLTWLYVNIYFLQVWENDGDVQRATEKRVDSQEVQPTT